MKNPKIGQHGEITPSETVSGGTVFPACDTVSLGGGFYACLDRPHHPDTAKLVAELRVSLNKPASRKQKKAGIVDDENV